MKKPFGDFDINVIKAMAEENKRRYAPDHLIYQCDACADNGQVITRRFEEFYQRDVEVVIPCPKCST